MTSHSLLKRENVELLMTDTDSLMLEIKTKDLWGDIDKLNMYFGNWIEQEAMSRMEILGSLRVRLVKTQSLSS